MLSHFLRSKEKRMASKTVKITLWTLLALILGWVFAMWRASENDR
jgi:hypothetical protein